MADGNNAYKCGDSGTTLDVNYNGLTLSPGDVVSWQLISKGGFETGCVTITDVDVSDSSYSAQTQYTDCYDCLNNNNGVVELSNCARGTDSIILPVSDLGSFLEVGTVIYATIDVNVKGITVRITSCWTIDGYSTPTTENYNRLNLSSIVTLGGNYVGFIDNCTECLVENLSPYAVTRCLEGTIDHVLLLGDGYVGNVISYTDGVNIYCGTVGDQEAGSPEWLFVQDFGVPVYNGEACDLCLTTSNQKVLLEDCTNPENQLVVWASNLFGSGEFSHLSSSLGCFKVIGPTEEAVTESYFLDFVPSPGCSPCIECNGVLKGYIECGDEPSSGSVLIYEDIPYGTVIYSPNRERCITIDKTTTMPQDHTLYSMTTFEGCTDCSENANFELWEGSICETGQIIYVSTVSSAGLSAGNIVKAMWGSNEYVCIELLATAAGGDSGTWYDTKKDSLGNSELYDDCNTCVGSSTIVVGLINCDTDEDSYVTISLSNYLSIIGNGFSLPNYTIRDQRQNCYTITSVCPLPSSASTESMLAVYFYFSCQYCPDQIITSANTEYNTCVICCECGSTGSTVNSVSTPHPIYTDGYNNPIMQLNMVVLGGTNGLNA